jgi:hypothetical protein
MAKQPVKKKTATNTLNLSIADKMDFINKFKEDKGLNGVKDKELEWYVFPQAFSDAIKIPGIPKGFFTIIRGRNNTGKSTAKIHAIIEAQRHGDLPIIYETESNFPWAHAREMGMEFIDVWGEEVNEETGEIEKKIVDHTGFFIFYDNDKLFEKYGCIDHTTGEMKTKPTRNVPVIEDISYSMNEYMDLQADGTIKMNILFVWDSVGSIISYRSATAKIVNNMFDAGAVNSCFKSIVNNRIPSSRKETSNYYSTFLVINKIWIDNMQMGGPQVKNSNGESFGYGARLIIHMGGITSSAVEKLKAVSVGETYYYGTKTKIKVEKNQINDITYEGAICCTSHGFWSPDKLDEYKKQYSKFLIQRLNQMNNKAIDENAEIQLETEEDTEF